jgi:hypothetical protein
MSRNSKSSSRVWFGRRSLLKARRRTQPAPREALTLPGAVNVSGKTDRELTGLCAESQASGLVLPSLCFFRAIPMVSEAESTKRAGSRITFARGPVRGPWSPWFFQWDLPYLGNNDITAAVTLWLVCNRNTHCRRTQSMWVIRLISVDKFQHRRSRLIEPFPSRCHSRFRDVTEGLHRDVNHPLTAPTILDTPATSIQALQDGLPGRKRSLDPEGLRCPGSSGVAGTKRSLHGPGPPLQLQPVLQSWAGCPIEERQGRDGDSGRIGQLAPLPLAFNVPNSLTFMRGVRPGRQIRVQMRASEVVLRRSLPESGYTQRGHGSRNGDATR